MRSRIKSLQSPIILLVVVATIAFYGQRAFGQQLDSTEANDSATSVSLTTQKTDPQKKTTSNQRGFFESIRGSIDFGAHFRDLSGSKPGKFEQFKDFRNAPILRNLFLKFESGNSPTFFDARINEAGERDARYATEFGRIGKYRFSFMWDQIPQYYSTGTTLHSMTSPGLLTVDPNIRAALQAVPDAANPPQTLGPTLPNLVRQFIAAAPVIQLRTRSDQMLVTASIHPNQNWEFFFRAQYLRMNGTRPKSTGTFGRQAVGPAGDGVWESLGMELPEPVRYHTINLTFGFQYAKPKWRFGADYNVSLFRDSIPILTWENPFRVTDAIAVAPAFAVGRNRFVRAQLALPPDNDFQSISVHGGVDLPRDTQIRGVFTWGRGTQNQAFPAYTLNSALVTANLPAGVPGLFGLALPQSSLNGLIHTIDQDYTIASHPWKSNKLFLQYRSNSRNNLSPDITFPALPAFGDSSERTAVDFYNLPIETLPTSYTHQIITGTWQWDPNKKFSWEMEYNWDIWNRKFRDAPRTNEHSIQANFSYKPDFLRGATFKGDYLYADRTPTFYLTQPLSFLSPIAGSTLGGYVATTTTRFIRGIPLEFNLLRRFDEDKRIRNDGGVSIEKNFSDKLTYSASYRYQRDDYDKAAYGLNYDVTSTVFGQVTYFPKDNAYFYADYSREQQQYGYKDLGHLIAGAVQNVTACCAQFPFANTFNRDTRAKLDLFEVGFNTSTAGEKTVLDMSYGLGFARDRTHTVNPFPILANSPLQAGAYNYPDVINRQQELNVTLSHKIREGFDVGATYRFEPYRLDDYYLNNLQPYLGPTISTAGGRATAPVPRQLFLDARFATSHANAVTVFARYSF
jgi:MtrB/PioB family decaheme-associated outer membrane protein